MTPGAGAAAIAPVVASWQPDFRPFRLSTARRGYAVSAPRRWVALVDPLLTPLARIDVGRVAKLEAFADVASHPSHDLIAIASPDGAAVLTAGGAVLERHTHDTLAVAWEGDVLWSVERLDSSRVRVSVWDAGFDDRLASCEVPDELGDSSAVLTRAPGGWLLTLAAGQDGAVTLLLSRVGARVSATALPALAGAAPPDFAPDAGRCLASFDEVEELRLLAWPGLEVLGVHRRELAPAGADLVLDSSTAIVDADGRRWLLDLSTMTLGAELLVAGHGLRPMREVYLGLDDETPTTDVVALHHAAPGQLLATTYRGVDVPGEVLLVDVTAALGTPL